MKNNIDTNLRKHIGISHDKPEVLYESQKHFNKDKVVVYDLTSARNRVISNIDMNLSIETVSIDYLIDTDISIDYLIDTDISIDYLIDTDISIDFLIDNDISIDFLLFLIDFYHFFNRYFKGI